MNHKESELEVVCNVRAWPANPGINEMFYIAERIPDMSTIKIELREYCPLPFKYKGSQCYGRLNKEA